MANLLTNLFRPRAAEITRYNLSQYLQERVRAIESMTFPGFSSAVSVGGRVVEQVENSYTGYVGGAYKTDSVVAACMRVRRDIFRQARFCWREMNDNGPGRIFADGELSLLERPWPNGTTCELLTRMITDVDLCGNAYVINEGDRLRWLRPDWVSIILSGDPAEELVDVKGYIYSPGGANLEQGTVYLPNEVCHWSPLPDPLAQYRGMSWLTPAIREIQADKAATEHKLMFFLNGATMGPIFTLPKEVSVEQFKDFVAAADAAHVGVQNAYRPVYVGGGADVTLGSATLQQIEFKATQGAGETRIAALAGVHPVLVGLSEGLSGSSLNAGNFNSARRSTADITLWPLWQDVCAALSAFVSVPDGAELWIRDKEIPFLREDAKDRAEITKERMLGIEAGIRAGFKPDALVEAFVTDDINSLHGQHSNLFSVQLQPANPNGQAPLDTTEKPPVNFGALRARAFVRRLAIETGDDDDLEDELDELERRYNVRIPKGFEGGGRFRKLSDRLTALLKDWANGEGPDDPLDEFSRDQLRRMAKEFADKAKADGDDERAARLTPRRGASSEEIKLALYKDVRAEVRGERDQKAETGPKSAKFTLQGLGDAEKVREVEVENKIRTAYRDAIAAGDEGPYGRPRNPENAPRAGSYVMLRHVRRRVGTDVSREEFDAALKRLDREGKANLTPQENQKQLTPEDRETAIFYGGSSSHMVSVNDPSPRPRPAASKNRDLDVAVYRDKDGKLALFEEDDRGERGSLVERFDSLDDLEAWARDNGEPRLAEWARTERGAPEKVARDRQARVDSARRVAETLSAVDELVENKATRRALEHRLESERKFGTPDDVVDELKAALPDSEKVRETLVGIAKRHGLTPVGKAGQLEPFDRERHQMMGDAKQPAVGTFVHVARPGYEFDDNGKKVRVGRAVVFEATPDEIAEWKQRGGKAPVKKATPANRTPGKAPSSIIPSPADQDFVARRQRLIDHVGEKPRVVSKFDAGGSGTAELVEFSDGTRAVRKTGNWPRPNQQEAEELGAMVLDAIGGRSAAAVRSGDNEMLVEFVDGQSGSDLDAETLDKFFDSPAGRLMGLADVLMSNQDRKSGNWMSADGDLVGIDHGRAFTEAGEALTNPAIVVGGLSPFAAYLADRVELKDKVDLGGIDLSGVRARLVALKPEFDRLGHPEWHGRMMARLAEIERRATVPAKKATPSAGPPDLTGEDLRDALDLRTVPQLKDLLRERGLPLSGRKRELVDRLVEAVGTGAPAPGRPSGLPTGRKLESGDFDDLAERITGKSESTILEILQDLNAAELARLARKFSGSRGGGGLGGEQNKPRGIAIPAGLSLDERRRWLAKQLSDQRFAWRSMDLDEDDEGDEDFAEVVRSEPDEEDEEAIRAAGGDTFREYWTRGEGLAKWVTHPHPWTALRNHLRKHVGQARANRIASQWFKLVFGIWPGERKGQNPVGPG